MPNTTIEERVARLEEQVALLASDKGKPEQAPPWWEQIAGTFADSEEYDAAMEAGRAYRESLRPDDESNAPKADK